MPACIDPTRQTVMPARVPSLGRWDTHSHTSGGPSAFIHMLDHDGSTFHPDNAAAYRYESWVALDHLWYQTLEHPAPGELNSNRGPYSDGIFLHPDLDPRS
ncbi:hypothetical protein X797_012324 [Metarhizium robertsii]|uniref:Uncharacterized protein n=1 Tax=Metarhizium robertsii TaxID=568076 RepID=A0A014PGA1_9HYPO|nr:hypothetical protein X797_012324 [Metarhizium robertsii]